MTKQELLEALRFVREEADRRMEDAREARHSDRHQDAIHHSGVAYGMQVAAMAIETRLLGLNGR